MKIVQTIFSADKMRKVQFVQNHDGTYGFTSLKLGEEECWYPCGRYSQCHAATLDLAVREAEGRIRWLRDRLALPDTGDWKAKSANT